MDQNSPTKATISCLLPVLSTYVLHRGFVNEWPVLDLTVLIYHQVRSNRCPEPSPCWTMHPVIEHRSYDLSTNQSARSGELNNASAECSVNNLLRILKNHWIVSSLVAVHNRSRVFTDALFKQNARLKESRSQLLLPAWVLDAMPGLVYSNSMISPYTKPDKVQINWQVYIIIRS